MKVIAFYLKHISLLTFFIYFILIGCEKENVINTPSVTTSLATEITQIKATCTGYIKSKEGTKISSIGICWGRTTETISENSKYASTINDTFMVQLQKLQPNTKYYYCAFANHENGIAYGDVKTFTTLPQTFIEDMDGNSYKTLLIGKQEWMIENLKTTKYNNGDDIVTTEPSNLNIELETTPKYQWTYNADSKNIQEYGRLYTWYVATDERNVCPSGWHIPSIEEVKTLVNNLDYPLFGADELKEQGSVHWTMDNYSSNSSGFTAIGGGYRRYDGYWDELKFGGHWWTTTEEAGYNALTLELTSSGSNIIYRPTYKSNGISIRCVKD